jgi:hypothetical protein
MKPSFHEDFSRREKVEGTSNRSFGLTVGGVLLVIAAIRTALHVWAGTAASQPERAIAGVGLILIGLGLVAPACLGPLNRAWTRLGLVLFRVVNPVVLGLIYLTTIVPIGLLLRLLGRDVLDLKFDRRAASYWVLRMPPGPAPDTMINQF